MNTPDLILLIVILAWTLVFSPWHSLTEMKKMRSASAEDLPRLRRRSYRWTIIEQWSIVVLLMAGWVWLGRSPVEIGLSITFAGWQWLALGVTLAMIGIFSGHIWRAASRPEELAEVRGQLGHLVLIAPHTRDELKQFSWLSLTAGVCEEILYRGFLMTLLSSIMGLWPAVVTSSLIFGVGHAYQGPQGILRTGGVGLILALVVVFTGSLPAAILVHALMDTVQGRMLFAAVNEPEPGVS